MARIKYVVIKTTLDGCGSIELPVVFPELLNHSTVAQRLRGVVVGAGFCYHTEEGWKCFGESISCKVKSRGTDDDSVLNYHLQ